MPNSRYRHPTQNRSPSIRVAILALLLAALACNTPEPTATPTATLPPTPTSVPTATPEPPDTGWEMVEPGIELRQVRVLTGDVAERLQLIRLDPTRFRFRVRYTPGAARPVSEWITPDSFLVVNGGYFTPEHHTTGLLISDGQLFGTSFGDYAGMFTVLPGGRVEIRWLTEQPYDPTEMVLDALQSFPVLVKPGGVMGFPADADDGRPARRTVVAQDRTGQILFIIAPRGYLGLHEMACWLAESDLDIDTALNLDGGLSTGFHLAAEGRQIQVDSQVPVPSVVVVERR